MTRGTHVLISNFKNDKVWWLDDSKLIIKKSLMIKS
jgi:hypothetical protein